MCLIKKQELYKCTSIYFRTQAHVCVCVAVQIKSMRLKSFHNNTTLEIIEGAIQNGQSRETGYRRVQKTKKNKAQHNMCWTPLNTNKHK